MSHQPYHQQPMPAFHHQLAPHETLELHELLASKNIHLYSMKKTQSEITDPELRQIYSDSIRVCEQQIRELAAVLQNR